MSFPDLLLMTQDLQDNVSFYFGLGVQTYLVIDAVTSQGNARSQIYLHLWRSVKGTVQKLSAAIEGYFTLPEMGLKIRAIEQQIIFVDALTDKVLFDISDFSTVLASGQKMRNTLEKACQAAEEALQAEQEALQAEQKARLGHICYI